MNVPTLDPRLLWPTPHPCSSSFQSVSPYKLSPTSTQPLKTSKAPSPILFSLPSRDSFGSLNFPKQILLSTHRAVQFGDFTALPLTMCGCVVRLSVPARSEDKTLRARSKKPPQEHWSWRPQSPLRQDRSSPFHVGVPAHVALVSPELEDKTPVAEESKTPLSQDTEKSNWN